MDEPLLLRQIRDVYGARSRNPLDMAFPKPPAEWKERFLEMAHATKLNLNVDEAHGLVSSFLGRLKGLEKSLQPYIKRLEKRNSLVREQ